MGTNAEKICTNKWACPSLKNTNTDARLTQMTQIK